MPSPEAEPAQCGADDAAVAANEGAAAEEKERARWEPSMWTPNVLMALFNIFTHNNPWAITHGTTNAFWVNVLKEFD